MNHKKLGELLIDGALLTAIELEKALDQQKLHPDVLIGQILIDMDIMEPHHIEEYLERQKKLKKRLVSVY